MERMDRTEAGLFALFLVGLAGAAIVASAGLTEFSAAGRYALLFALIKSLSICMMLILGATFCGAALFFLRLKRRRTLSINCTRTPEVRPLGKECVGTCRSR